VKSIIFKLAFGVFQLHSFPSDTFLGLWKLYWHSPWKSLGIQRDPHWH